MTGHGPRPDRLVVAGGHVLTMDPATGDLPRADVLVENGRIADVRQDIEAPGAERIDARHCLVLPGFVDTHRHMWQAVLRGYGADQTLEEYFGATLHAYGSSLGPGELHLGNLLSALGALDAGVTTVQDISNATKSTEEHTDALVDALEESGIRAVFAYGHGPEADARRIRSRRLHSADALVTMALNAELGGDASVRRDWGLARELGIPLALHVRGGQPLSRLRRLGLLRPGTVYIHGTGLDRGELKLIADSGGALSIAPAIEMTMGHGLPPFAAAASAGLRPSLSADVEVAAGSDLFGQMRTAFQVSRFAVLHRHDDAPDRLPTSRDILEFATIEGARALGLDDRIGSLTPGKQADLVVLRADRPGVVPVHDAVKTVVCAMDRADVDTVLVAGRIVKRAGHLLRPDLAALVDRAAAVRDRLTG
ncbi:amidohydrolase family protein [Streptomyces afghaniensis]|uniref:amidohydrolase family protein n=1 Tax=Streptomyces afghaniensis TaxID=66865 RepID=UPI002780AD8B|nr:amidohydrolase family protein [Streptomyces afghaniensis]MDQ1019011.1 5-methylthioadenosine/S-adenosylhomocysteine deaminase [Streptomyces afghaniensis]